MPAAKQGLDDVKVLSVPTMVYASARPGSAFAAAALAAASLAAAAAA